MDIKRYLFFFLKNSEEILEQKNTTTEIINLPEKLKLNLNCQDKEFKDKSI